MGIECCACPTVPPSLCPGVHPLCQHRSVFEHSRWSMDCMSAHGKAELGWLQTGHTGTLSSSSQSQLPSAPWLCHLPALWVLLPGGCQAGCSQQALRPCCARAPAGWGSQIPDPLDSPCCHSVVRCQGCRHHWVTPVGERGETVGLDTGTWDCCPLPVPVGCRTEGDLDTPPSGARAWQSFRFHHQLKESRETHSASRDRDPRDSSCTLHRASLVSSTTAGLDWAGGLPHPPLSTGPLPHAVLLRGAGRSWHESCWHRGSGVCGALQLPRAGGNASPLRLCACLGRDAQHWMPELVALRQAEVVPGEGLPPPAVFGGAGTIVLSPWSRCSGGHVRAQPGRAALGGRWEPCPPWHMLIACNGESSISSNP